MKPAPEMIDSGLFYEWVVIRRRWRRWKEILIKQVDETGRFIIP